MGVTKENSAEQMNEQGMPSLQERAGDVKVSREGMPKNIGVPKPAPIPEGVDVYAKQPTILTDSDHLTSDVEQEKEQQKSAFVGLFTLIVLLIVAVILLLYFILK